MFCNTYVIFSLHGPLATNFYFKFLISRTVQNLNNKAPWEVSKIFSYNSFHDHYIFHTTSVYTKAQNHYVFVN